MVMKMKRIAATSSTTAATDTKLYTVSAVKQATGILFITNTSTATKFRVSLEASGAVAMAQYISYDTDIDAGETQTIEGISLYNLQELWVRSTSGNVAFTFVGAEEV
ncbi:hypothetical protein [Caudoviricetes sp.]|nr:hypothetical protein [Caudoviricetes sp.]